MQLLAGTAIIKDNKILLLESSESGQEKKWGPPAGHGEANETAEETAIRETKEETNLDVTLTGLIQVGYFNYKDTDYLCVFYLAEAKDLKNLKIQESEVSNYAWVGLDELENDKYVFRKKFLKEPIIKALTIAPSDKDLFKIYKVEK